EPGPVESDRAARPQFRQVGDDGGGVVEVGVSDGMDREQTIGQSQEEARRLPGDARPFASWSRADREAEGRTHSVGQLRRIQVARLLQKEDERDERLLELVTIQRGENFFSVS